MARYVSCYGTKRAVWRAVALAVAIGFGVTALPSLPALANLRRAPAAATVTLKESYKLPISPPRDQGDSDLCWVYATLNMLESNYLETHPHSTIELSRAALQRDSIADRFRRQITGNSSHLEDGGLAVDAIALIRQNGLVAESDFHGIVDSDPLFAWVSKRLAGIAGESVKLATLDTTLAGALGVQPAKTHLDGKALTPADVAKFALGDNVWTEYDVTTGAPHVGPSDDPDARPETRVHYVRLATAIDLIHASLARGQAVVWGRTDNHALLIYGADYDGDGRPVAYWVKDSFAPYTYRQAAADLHRVLTDVTVAEPATDEGTTARN